MCSTTKTTGYIRLGPHMPDIILVKQEMDYELTGEQVAAFPVQQSSLRSVDPIHTGPLDWRGSALPEVGVPGALPAGLTSEHSTCVVGGARVRREALGTDACVL